MFYRRYSILALVAALFSVAAAQAADDAAGKNHCVLDAFAKKLEFTPEQKTQVAAIHEDAEKKLAPLCESIWLLHWTHHQNVLQILSAEQRNELPNIVKAERTRMLKQFSDKLALTDDQKAAVEKMCNEYGPKFQQLDPKDPKVSEKFQSLKSEHFEAFCRILTDDQRVKLPALIQEELQAGRTPSSKSELRNAMVEKLGLTDDQKQRLDKVCDEYATKIEEQKTRIRDLCKEKQAAIEKVLTEPQRTRFRDYVKATNEK